jgi:hypothetical protein
MSAARRGHRPHAATGAAPTFSALVASDSAGVKATRKGTLGDLQDAADADDREDTHMNLGNLGSSTKKGVLDD